MSSLRTSARSSAASRMGTGASSNVWIVSFSITWCSLASPFELPLMLPCMWGNKWSRILGGMIDLFLSFGPHTLTPRYAIVESYATFK